MSWFRKFVVAFWIFLLSSSLYIIDIHPTPIVNNSGSSSEDSLTFNILNTRPSGNPAKKLDSCYLTIFKSNTNDVVFRDSATGVTMTGVDSFVIGGDVCYYFHRAVADIDGAGDPGVYSYSFLAVYDDSAMRTPTLGQFQIVGWELDQMGDSAGLAAVNSDLALDSLHLIIDSLVAVLDTLQNRDSSWQYLGFVDGFRSENHTNANVDTVFLFNAGGGGGDTVGAIIYFHPGGAAGDDPDSTRFIVH